MGSVLVYAAFQLNRYVGHWPVPALLSSYLGDVASMPVILSVALAAQRRLVMHSRTFVFPWSWLLAAWAYVSVWFELALPYFSARAVADPLDVVAYAVGTLAFGRWLNRPG
ncbi:hypothetical protein ACFQT0_24920 [Hymenobacter humi]|uniref:Magnesium citrate secondary transporter n=1 Tax=Hymenobacter humi TaxID=1411620 RepID=A0ABW2U9S3_9BACT